MAEYISFLKRKLLKPQIAEQPCGELENSYGNVYTKSATFLKKEPDSKTVQKDDDEEFFKKIRKIVEKAKKK